VQLKNADEYFIKWNQGDHQGLFDAEAKKLRFNRKNFLHLRTERYGHRNDGRERILDDGMYSIR